MKSKAPSPLAQPPRAPQRPEDLSIHARQRTDPYYWMRDDNRDDPEVLAHLRAENQYTCEVLAPSLSLREEIHREIVNRLPGQDRSVPYDMGPFSYFDYVEADMEHEVFCRYPLGRPEEIQVLLDLNDRADGHPFYELGGMEISDDHNLMAVAEDFVGDGRFELRILDLSGRTFLNDRLLGLSGELAWSGDGQQVFYVHLNAETQRADQIYRHVLGTPQAEDKLVLEETDTGFELSLGRSRSLKFIEILSASTLATELHLIDAAEPESVPQIFLPRVRGHEYFVCERGDEFFVLTNWNAPNFRICRTNWDGRDNPEQWDTLIAHRTDSLLVELEVFENHLVYAERVRCMQRLQCFDLRSGTIRAIPLVQKADHATLDDNPTPGSPFVRFAQSTLVHPWSVWDYPLAGGDPSRRKLDRVGAGFDPDRYATHHLLVSARDGSQIPVFLAHHKDTRPEAAPALLEVYGAYGACLDPTFSYAIPSLLDRGFVYGLVQVRGGMEKGRQWYESGRKLHKHNSITDFLDSAQYLQTEGWAQTGLVSGMGASAGGLIIGAAANMAPELFFAMIACVPFVDVVTTMLDPSIPLTSLEYDEWGNPERETEFEAMMAISPYDNVQAQAYPNMLITAGLHDFSVGYWEPAKWAARLRSKRTDAGLTLLHTEMEAGHQGQSGRFKAHAETALHYGFLLHCLEQKKTRQ